MPKVVENLFSNAATLSAPPRKSAPPKGDSQDSFEKALQQAKPKPAPAPAPATDSKKPDNTSKPEKSDDNSSDVATDQSQTSDDQTTSENSADSQPSDTTVSTEQPKKPEKKPGEAEPSNPEPVDSVELSALAAVQPTVAPQTPQPAQAADPAAATEERPATAAVKPAVAPPTKPALPAPAIAKALAAKEMPKEADTAHQEQPSDGEAQPQQDQTPTDSEIPQPATDEPSAPAKAEHVAQQMPVPQSPSEPAPEQSKPATRRAQAPAAAQSVADQATQALADAPEEQTAPAGKADNTTSAIPTTIVPVGAEPMQAKSAAPVGQPAAPQAPAPPPDPDFASSNHERIVSSVRTQLLPTGGTMHMRLDPPELGVLQVSVRMVDGAMSASFETSNDQATRLLSHSLGQLKQALETQGVSVEKLHVQQTPRDQQNSPSGEDRDRNSSQDDQTARREQQRRETLNRMWRRLRLGRDPLDLVA